MIESYPLETHAFKGDGNEFLCSVCQRPRLMHYRYPFRPKPDPEAMFKDPTVKFRGPHPRFTPPGRMKSDEMPTISKAKREYAERVRKAERDLMDRLTRTGVTPHEHQ